MKSRRSFLKETAFAGAGSFVSARIHQDAGKST